MLENFKVGQALIAIGLIRTEDGTHVEG